MTAEPADCPHSYQGVGHDTCAACPLGSADACPYKDTCQLCGKVPGREIIGGPFHHICEGCEAIIEKYEAGKKSYLEMRKNIRMKYPGNRVPKGVPK